MPSDLDQLAQDATHQDRWQTPRWSNDLGTLAGQQQMTHQPEQPNPAAPWLAGARAIGGIPLEMLRGFNQNIGRMVTGTPEEQGQASGRFVLDALGAIVPFGRTAASTLYGGIPWKPAELTALKKIYGSSARSDVDRVEQAMSVLPGRSRSSIWGKVNELGISKPPEGPYVRQPGAPIMQGDKEKIDQLLMMMSRQNMTVPQMAERLGVSERTLRRYINEDLQVRLHQQSIGNNPARVKQYKDLLAQGLLPQQIARKLRIPETTVYDNLRMLSRSGQLKYIPEAGTRTPGMPRFTFQDEVVKGDPDYERTLLEYLRSRQ